ncbi:MAG: LPS export ABC transporter periplasmic protein LptC [Elusimicrobiota bacterium]
MGQSYKVLYHRYTKIKTESEPTLKCRRISVLGSRTCSGYLVDVFFSLWLAVTVVMQFSCSRKVEKIVINDSFPDQVVKNFSIDKYELENQKWNFVADRGDIYEKRNSINTKKIKMTFYENNKKISSIITADNAGMQTKTGDIQASGNVVIFSLSRATTIFTESINYSEKTGKVLSDSPIRQEKQDVTITGIGLEANADLSDITILKNVKVIKK